MRTKVIFIILLVSGCFYAHAQQGRGVDYYLKNKDVSKAAKDYYLGNAEPGDDDTTYSIADSMNTQNDDTRPFYIFLVSRMLHYKENRAVTEGLGIICKHYIQNDPNHLVQFLFGEDPLARPEYKDVWVKAIAREIRLSCEGDLVQCMRKSRVITLDRCDEDNKPQVEVLFNMIRAELKGSVQ